MLEHLCKSCGTTFLRYNSAQTKCGKCQYNRLRRKPIKRVGKIAKKWIETRNEWIRLNPGPWTCYLCSKSLDIDTLTLDHVKSRSRRPDLRFELSNLQPACLSCNVDKGSRDIDELRS